MTSPELCLLIALDQLALLLFFALLMSHYSATNMLSLCHGKIETGCSDLLRLYTFSTRLLPPQSLGRTLIGSAWITSPHPGLVIRDDRGNWLDLGHVLYPGSGSWAGHCD